MSMNMSIAGSGKIPSGEYEKISISGSGHLYENVRCTSFSSSGSSHGDSIECSESFKVAGSSSFSENIKAKNIVISGSLSCGGDFIAEEKISCAGSVKCKGNTKCESLCVAGALKVEGDIEAEDVRTDGTINCGGLLNAESIEIKFNRGMNIGSIGGSRIVIHVKEKNNIIIRLPLFSSLASNTMSEVTVSSSIEGDEIALERVSCPRVTGRVVAIGEGCKIDLVQYSEQIEISPDAEVGATEKI